MRSRKLFAAIVCLCVLLCCAVTAAATQAEPVCPHCNEVVTWTAWDGTKPTETVHVYLPEGGLTVQPGSGVSLSSGVTMVLDLRGQTLARDTSGTSKLFLVNSGAKLVILDSSSEKTGTIIGRQKSTLHAGIAQIYGGDLDIYGGTFKMTDDTEVKNGGLFLASTQTTAPTVNIYGGTFYGTKAAQGGVLQFGGNKLNIEGGTFYAGTATKGDSIYLSSGDMSIRDAVIQGGVQVSTDASLSVSGKSEILKTADGSAYSVQLPAGKTVSVGALEEGAKIGITLAEDGVFTADFADAAAAEAAKDFFVSDDGKKIITVEGNALKCAVEAPTDGSVYCQHCDAYVFFGSWDGTTVPAAGHYKLEGTTSVSSCKTLAADSGEVVIDLAGQTLQMAAGKNKMFMIQSGAKLVFLDSSSDKTGTVISYQKADYHAGVAQLIGGDLDIYGGTFKMTDDSVVSNGGLFYAYNGAQINIYGGTFHGITAVRGGILYITSGKLNIEGGTFYPGTGTTAGDGIYMNGSSVEVTISGEPVIYGGMYAYSVKSLTISGKPYIKRESGSTTKYSLKLGKDEAITAGQLEEGALIGLNHYENNTVQVKGFADVVAAAAAVKYFVPETANRMLYANRGSLIITTKPTATTFECEHCDETVEWKVWDGKSTPAAGHYYLSDNTEVTRNVSLTAAGDVVLNLNGYTLTKKDAGRMFLVQSGSSLTIMDSSAKKTGTVISNGINNHGMIAMAYNAADAVVNIYGGNFYDGSSVAAKNGALLCASSGGVLNIRGGEFWGGKAASGGAVAATTGATLEITGGMFMPGKITGYGATIFASGEQTKVTIGGDAFIQGGAYIGDVASFTLSGTPVISRDAKGAVAYSLKTATPADAAGLAQGAHVRVTLLDDEHPTFTTAFATEADAKAAAIYFAADASPAETIALSGTALTCAAPVPGAAALNDPANDKTLNILMVGNSFCFYYVQELYGLLMEDLPEGIEEVQIYNLYYSGRNLTTHLARWENSQGDYELYRTNKDGRVDLHPVEFWSLEMALAQENWDYISLQGASSGYSYADESKRELTKELISADATPLLGRMYEMFPSAQLLWHRTWAFEVGRISGSTVYDEALLAAYDAGIHDVCTWMTTEFDQDKPYDLMMVNSGSAWKEARILNETQDLLPIGGLCARKGVANESTYKYAKDNPDAKDVGDAYHDGDIGGGQLLNAYMWYMTLTGDTDLSDNHYAPSTDNLAGYELAPELVTMLKTAAQKVMQPAEPEGVRGDLNNDGAVSDADAMYLLRYTLFGEERYPLSQSGDVNGDGAVSDADAMYLLRYTLFGEDRYPLH